MNTFLPFPNFYDSAHCLDTKRLRNQLNEYKVIKAALNGAKAWARHPATLMWQDNQAALDAYACHIAREMAHRGLPVPEWAPVLVDPDYTYPRWFGNEAFHMSHKRNLLRKDACWYSQFFGLELEDDVYAWPTKQPDGSWILRFKQVGAKKYQEHVEHFL